MSVNQLVYLNRVFVIPVTIIEYNRVFLKSKWETISGDGDSGNS